MDNELFRQSFILTDITDVGKFRQKATVNKEHHIFTFRWYTCTDENVLQFCYIIILHSY